MSDNMKTETYKLFLKVANGDLTTEQAQVELLALLETVHRDSPGTYTGEDIRTCKLGLYEIFWKDGGSSIAAVGNMHSGIRWIAPTNWTSKKDPTGRIDYEMVKKIDRMVLLYSN